MPSARTSLLGRGGECERLDAVLHGVRDGSGVVLVLRGEAGIGKSALLDYTAARAAGCDVVRAAGVQSEMELAFAGLHHLCTPLLGELERLPEPQREALRTTFGLRRGGPPNRFLVAVAVLSLLAGAADARPLVCLIDDAQWLDRASAQVLAFVARRLLAEPVAMIFAIREPADGDELAGLPELTLDGLADAAARRLLASAAHGRLDERVRDRVVAESRGNPLALLELPRRLSAAELTGGYVAPDGQPLASRIEQEFLVRLQALPRDTRLLLLAAAADPVGDASLLWRAAAGLGIDRAAGRSAEAAGLVEIGPLVTFKHPLVRSAIQRGAEPADRRAVHAALAAATDPVAAADRRAWHLAAAAAGPDEAVAAELLRSAARARERGGLAAAAAFLQRATELTPNPGVRAERGLAAAQAKLDVADPATASSLAAAAGLVPLDPLHDARLERLKAQITFTLRRGRDAPPLLLGAAQRLAPLDPAESRETFLEALAAAMFAGRLSTGAGIREVAAAARDAPPAPVPPRAADLLLDALVTRVADGYAAAVAPLAQALRACAEQDEGRWLWLACRLAQDLWDDELWHVLATRGVRVARDTGALATLPIALTYRAALFVHTGALAEAAALIEESDTITQVTGLSPVKYASLVLAAWRGDPARAQQLIAPALADATARGEGMGVSVCAWASAVVHNGGGRHGDALTAARRACEHDDVGMYGWALVELIEAAVRELRQDVAEAALARLSERTQASGGGWALGLQSRSRALVHGREDDYRESIERLAATRGVVQLARSELVYGEWLRRQGRRAEACEQLRAAHDRFSRSGAEAFAARARRELQATGERVRRLDVDARAALTPQEAQVARLARDGHTNPEIGAQLFISPRTVEYHLRKVFRKLDVSTRKDLRRVLATSPPAGSAS